MEKKEQKVVLFVDAQNMYKTARRLFFNPPSHYTDGQFNPVALGNLICSRPPPGFTRTLIDTRVYTGRPDGGRDPKGYGANRKQSQFWQTQGATVIARPLRYPPNYPAERPEEKGIDVLLALDFVTLAADAYYDVGIIASTDTDLIPAIDLVVSRYTSCIAEVTAWSTPQHRNPRLHSKHKSVWCHWMDQSDYDRVRDQTNYSY